MQDSSQLQIAYGRIVRELGLVPEAQLVQLGRACLEQNLDLRGHLLAQGLVSQQDDARILDVMRSRSQLPPTQADGSGVHPAPTQQRSTQSGTKSGGVLGGALPARLPAEGEVFGGCRIVREIARGGAGAVFVAQRPDGSECALKILLGDLSRKDRRERFLREVEIGKTLDHPGIVRVHDHGEERDLAYLTMELLQGARPLDDYVRDEQVPPEAVAKLVFEVAEAVQAAHQEGVIHRDLKPDNVLVTGEGAVKVVDFGLARDLDKQRLTQSGAVMGTLHYMAPEQVRGDTAHADARTDVYALGVILHRLISGTLPFEGSTGVEIMRAIVEDPPPDLRWSASDGGVDLSGLPGLAEVAAMAMAKAPDDRYATAAAFARDLVAVCAGSGVRSQAARHSRSRRRRRLAIGGAVAALLALGGAVGAYVWQQRGPAPLSADDARKQATALDKEARELLKLEGLLAGEAERAAALLARLEALEARAPAGAAEKRLRRAAVQVRAFSGLCALASGDPGAAAQTLAGLGEAEVPVVHALRGGLAALDPQADPKAAARLLARALARGIKRAEVRGWRARALARAGIQGETQVKETRADLEALAKARGGELLLEERWTDVRVCLAEGKGEQAEQRLKALERAPLELRWAVGLARATELLEKDPRAAFRTLKGLEPLEREPAGVPPLRKEALALARRILEGLGKDGLGKAEEKRLILYARLAKRLGADPLPEALVRDMLEQATGLSSTHTGKKDLGLALTRLAPNDLEVHRQVGRLVIRFKSEENKRAMLQVLARAVELEQDTKQKTILQAIYVSQVGVINDKVGGKPNLEEVRQALQMAEQLAARLDDPVGKGTMLAARSRFLRLLGDLEASLRDVDEALEIHAAFDFHYYRACTLFALKRMPEAAQAALRFVEAVIDDSAKLDHAVGMVWGITWRTKQAGLARKAVRKLLTFRPYAGWWVRLALLELDLGDAAQAAKCVAKSATLEAGQVPESLRVRIASLGELVKRGGAPAKQALTQVVVALEKLRGPNGREP